MATKVHSSYFGHGLLFLKLLTLTIMDMLIAQSGKERHDLSNMKSAMS